MQMKLKLKALAGAVALAVGGHASAALSDAFVQDGTMFLTVYDAVNNESYVRDLGITLSQLLPNSVGGSATPEAGYNQVFGNLAGSTVFTTLFGDNNAANLRWNVVAVDAVEGDGVNNGSRVSSTFNSAPNVLNGAIRAYSSQAVLFASDLVANSGVDFTGAPNEFGYAGNGATAVEGGGPNWAPALAGGGNGNTFATGFGSIAFWFGFTSNDAAGQDAANGTYTRFGNSLNFATMTLDSTGVLTYNLEPADVAAVPLPAAAWMMGVGLLGFGRYVRRRKAVSAEA